MDQRCTHLLCNLVRLTSYNWSPQIEPDYIEYFYDDLRPNVHYLPASLDNVTDVTAYAMNEMNNKQMKDMVASANSWCKRTLTEGVLITDAMFQLDEYEASLEIYADNHGSWLDEWCWLMT